MQMPLYFVFLCMLVLLNVRQQTAFLNMHAFCILSVFLSVYVFLCLFESLWLINYGHPLFCISCLIMQHMHLLWCPQ